MTAAVWILAALSLLLGGAASAFLGLWLGERGKRQALEFLTGQYLPGRAQEKYGSVVLPGTEEPEERVDELVLEDERDALADELVVTAEEEGRPMSQEEAAEHATELLAEIYSDTPTY